MRRYDVEVEFKSREGSISKAMPLGEMYVTTKRVEGTTYCLASEVEALESFCTGLEGVNDGLRENLAAAVSMAEERLAKNEEAARKLAEVESERDEASESCDNWLIQAQELRKQRDLAVQGRAGFRIAFREQKVRAERAEADAIHNAEMWNTEVDHCKQAREANGRLVAALKGASMALHYEVSASIFNTVIETVDAALAEARKESTP